MYFRKAFRRFDYFNHHTAVFLLRIMKNGSELQFYTGVIGQTYARGC